MEQSKEMFEALVVTKPNRSARQGRTLTLPLSVAVHAVVFSAVVVIPVLTSEGLPDPTGSAVRAFFAEPVAPPPPPPPPAKAPAARVEPTPPVTPPTAFTSPVETPDQVVPETAAGLGLDSGPEGVEGGVPGGVVGGIVGGLPDAPPPPQPVRVGGVIKVPKKLRHVDPVYPRIAAVARVQGIVVLECLLSPEGRVAEVKVLQGIPLLDEAAVQAVKQWVFTPTLFNGVPVPAIMTVNVRFAL
ncbi:MAG TPA: energy transducer TonB [Vicinamibacteria bacterium]|jgi:protein TonB|nr:energy transducer TonB [Vicinamibacteria bacterium]